MPRGVPKNKNENNLKINIDTMKNESNKPESQADFNDTSDADNVFKLVAEQATESKPAPKKADHKLPDLNTKYPSRTLEDLRKIDFIHQYESKFPHIDRPGYVTAWICNTPFNNFRETYYKQGYDYLDVNEYPPIPSGYSDQTGEDKYAHYAMQIPKEIYDKKQKALQELNSKMYGNILKPDKKGKEIDGDGMYDPKGREVKTVGKVLTMDQN